MQRRPLLGALIVACLAAASGCFAMAWRSAGRPAPGAVRGSRLRRQYSTTRPAQGWDRRTGRSGPLGPVHRCGWRYRRSGCRPRWCPWVSTARDTCRCPIPPWPVGIGQGALPLYLGPPSSWGTSTVIAGRRSSIGSAVCDSVRRFEWREPTARRPRTRSEGSPSFRRPTSPRGRCSPPRHEPPFGSSPVAAPSTRARAAMATRSSSGVTRRRPDRRLSRHRRPEGSGEGRHSSGAGSAMVVRVGLLDTTGVDRVADPPSARAAFPVSVEAPTRAGIPEDRADWSFPGRDASATPHWLRTQPRIGTSAQIQ